MIKSLRLPTGLRLVSTLVLGVLMVTSLSAQSDLAVNLDKTDLICHGLPFGEVQAVASGGAAPYSYLWSTGDTTAIIDRLLAGDYSVTVTDNVGDTVSASTTLTQPTKLEVTLSADQCVLPTPITANPSGGTGSYTYKWTTGDDTQTITVNDPGTYCVTVTDENLCGRVACIDISANPPALDLNVNDVTCPGAEDGVIMSSVEGGEGVISYAWSTGDTTATLTGLAPGTYSLTITDEVGCTDEATATVTQPDDLVISLTGTDPTCAGDSTGAIATQLSGGTPPYAVSWNTGGTTSDLSNLPAGTYVLTVTDDNGCTAIDSITLSNQSNLALTLDVRDETCPDEDDGLIIAIPSDGVEPYSYAWSTGATTQFADDLAPGTYSVTVTDALGCEIISDTATVEESPDFSFDLTATATTQPGEADGTATVTITDGMGPFSFAWSTGDTTTTIDSLLAGDYTITVTRDEDGCEKMDTVRVPETDSLIVIITTPEDVCPGDSTGTVQAQIRGGTPPYEILWNTGDTTALITGLPAGTYTVTVTDALGVVRVASVTLDAFPQPVVGLDATEIVCGGEDLGQIISTVSDGTPDYSYLWSTGDITADLDSLGTGSYSLTVTDANGCTAEAAARIEVIDEIVLEVVGSNLFCYNDSTGGVSVTATGGKGPFSYLWSTGDTTAQVNGLPAGTYAVTVTDTVQCSATGSVTISEPSEIITDGTVQDVVCGVDSTGSIIAMAMGGFGPYQFDWSNGGTGDTLEDLSGGTYFLTVTDATGCIQTDSFTVADPGNPVCEVSITQLASSPLSMDGEATVSIMGGEMPYMIQWSNGDTGPVADSLSAGTYSVTVTDANGCTTECGITLTPEQALIGDFVWLDLDRDGIQDVEGEEGSSGPENNPEPGIPGIRVILTPVGDCDSLSADTTFTNAEGRYFFTALPCDYKLTFDVPDSLAITLPNQGLDPARDSDIDRVMGMTDTFTVEAGETDLTWDAGLLPAPEARFENVCNCLNNATTEDNGQFEETLVVFNGIPGDTWTVIGQTGIFTADSPEPPAAPTPLPLGTTLTGDGMGEFTLPFRAVDSIAYSITVTNRVDTITLGGLCTYPDISLANFADGPIELCFTEAPIFLVFLTSVPGEVEVLLDGMPIEEIDPREIGLGTYTLTINLFPDDPDECQATLVRELSIITEGCPAKLGDFVWFDENENGLQDTGEPGVAAVEVILQQPDGTPVDTAYTDNNGMYMFTIDAGDYKVNFNKTAAYDLTAANAGDDTRDSDADPLTMMTEVVSLGEGEVNNTIDAGLVAPCVNVTDPGEIGNDQMLCGPGNDPDPLISIRPATGGEGELEYLWMYAEAEEIEGGFQPGLFQPIPNSNSETYDPGPLFTTTYFARCARRVGCPGFLEPELVKITVKDDALATIAGPSIVCSDDVATFSVVTKTDKPDAIQWELVSGGMIPQSGFTERDFTVSFTSFGRFTIRVMVTENECTAMGEFTFVVTENPTYCADATLAIQASAIDETRAVKIAWDIVDDGEDYTFEVQHAPDGDTYEKLAVVKSPQRIESGVRYYEYVDEYPKAGRNYYRVKIVNRQGTQEFSEPVELFLGDRQSRVLVYPNPVKDRLVIEFMEQMPTDMEIEISDANGKRLRTFMVDGQTTLENLNMSTLPTGMYFIRIKMSRDVTEVLKVWKME